MSYRIERYGLLEDIPAGIWDSLVAAMPSSTVFQSYGWHKACVHAYGAGQGLVLLAAYEGDACTGIAPFFVSRRGSIRVLRFIGDERADYCDFIFAPEHTAVMADFLRVLRDAAEEWDELALSNIPEASVTNRVLMPAIRQQGWHACHLPSMPCPALVLAGHPATIEKVLGKKSLVRHTRFFADREGLETRHWQDAGEIKKRLNAFFIQHIHRWSGRDQQSLFIFRENRDFYRTLVDTLGSSGKLLFTEVLSGGKPIAFHFGFCDRQKLLWYKPSFDISLARHYPGEVLLRELILWVRNRGLWELDFTRGNEAFKSRFANKERRNKSMIITRSYRRFWRLRLKAFLRQFSWCRRLFDFAGSLRLAAGAAIKGAAIVQRLRASASEADNQQDFYDGVSMNSYYRRSQGIQPAEAVILRELRPYLPSMRVLDIAMGAGRTSVYFGSLAREYTAFDYAPAMVKASCDLTGDVLPVTSFLQGDARRMSFIDDKSIDLALMSFNAIDCVNERDRALVIREIQRVVHKGGWFCFSSHNIQSLSLCGSGGLGAFVRRWARYRLMMLANPGLKGKLDAVQTMVADSSSDYAFPLVYIAPGEQVRQLEEYGFKDIRVFSGETGRELKSNADWSIARDPWLYYLCRT